MRVEEFRRRSLATFSFASRIIKSAGGAILLLFPPDFRYLITDQTAFLAKRRTAAAASRNCAHVDAGTHCRQIDGNLATTQAQEIFRQQ